MDDVDCRHCMEFARSNAVLDQERYSGQMDCVYSRARCWQRQYKKEFVMKRFWNISLLPLAMVAAISSAANGQGNWIRPSDGSADRPFASAVNLSSWGKSKTQDIAPTAPVADEASSVVNGAAQDYVSGNIGECESSCEAPVAARTSNWTIGVKGLYFTRDHEDDIRLSRNGAGEILLSTDANMNTMGGVQTDITKRNCDGSGFQLIYWGLYPGEAFDEILGPGLSSYRTGLAGVAIDPGAQSLLTYFDNADANYAYRTNEIHNFEANLLRSRGAYTTRRGRNATFELLGGFRWFQFNETFGIGAFSGAGTPTAVEYEIDVENTLLGLQLGGRSDYCLSDRLGVFVGAKVGVFNNRVNHDQRITDGTGTLAYRSAAGVDDYDFSSNKDDMSMLGELDFGMNYRISCNSRIVCGYRLVGISGIALAPDQIPNDFTLDADINSINSNGDLILGGGYAGFEFSF